MPAGPLAVSLSGTDRRAAAGQTTHGGRGERRRVGHEPTAAVGQLPADRHQRATRHQVQRGRLVRGRQEAVEVERGFHGEECVCVGGEVHQVLGGDLEGACAGRARVDQLTTAASAPCSSPTRCRCTTIVGDHVLVEAVGRAVLRARRSSATGAVLSMLRATLVNVALLPALSVTTTWPVRSRLRCSTPAGSSCWSMPDPTAHRCA